MKNYITWKTSQKRHIERNTTSTLHTYLLLLSLFLISASDHIIADRECTAHFDEANSQICEPWLTCGQCSDDGDEAPRVCRDADELGGKTSMTNILSINIELLQFLNGILY